MRVSELKYKITSILRERSTYKLGTQEYTKKNLTPTDILDLAMAYSQVQGKGTTIYGRKMEKMIKVGNDLAKLNGTTQQDAKKRGSKPALILTLLKNKLVTKDEYISLYKNLLSKQTSVVKALKNADPASRAVGGAAARAAHKDMKSESVNESINISEGKHDLILDKLADLVKGAKSFMDIGNQLKKQKIKYSFSTSMMPIYRLDKLPIAIVNKKYTKPNKAAGDRVVGDTVIGLMESIKESVNEMAMGFDSMTGLFYLQGVPFTRERMKEVILFMKSSKPKSKVSQFEYTPALIVKDKVGKNEVIIDPKNLKTLIEFYKKNSAKLASDKDF